MRVWPACLYIMAAATPAHADSVKSARQLSSGIELRTENGRNHTLQAGLRQRACSHQDGRLFRRDHADRAPGLPVIASHPGGTSKRRHPHSPGIRPPEPVAKR